MARNVKSYTRSDGTRVRAHKRQGARKKKYTPSQQRAFEKSKTSKSGHQSYKKRQRSRKPGLWANTWNKRRREGSWRPKKK